ncbi:MAG: energy transducer TonB [Acidobacteriia bacterium]|nr:energy transducer TonB [Terriglobia bacterium]
MIRHSLRYLLVLCVLMVTAGLLLAVAPEEKTAPPAGQVSIEALAKKKIKLVKMVKPVYPPEAKKQGVEGDVMIDVIISKKGEVSEATATSGPQVLREAALAAVRQWRYTPPPVDVKMTIHVNFQLTKKKTSEPKS